MNLRSFLYFFARLLAAPAAFRSPEALRAQLWENLRALRRSRVDVLQVHIAEQACWWKAGASSDQLLSLDVQYDFVNAPVMEVLREARAEGLCRFIGITADRAEELAQVLDHVEVDACLVAYDYTLLCRRALQNALPLAYKKGVAYIAAGVIKSIDAPRGQSPDARLNTLPSDLHQAIEELGLS